MLVQEIVLDIAPQEYLLRTVVTIIPVSQLSKHRQPSSKQQQQQQHSHKNQQQQQQQPQQTAQQVSAFASPFKRQSQRPAGASQLSGQGSLELPLSGQDSLEQPLLGQGSLEQPLLRSPSQMPATAPSTSEVHLNVIPEDAEAQDGADTGPSQDQHEAQQVTCA